MAIAHPASPNRTYVFACPDSDADSRIQIGTVAGVQTVDMVPAGCIEAKLDRHAE